MRVIIHFFSNFSRIAAYYEKSHRSESPSMNCTLPIVSESYCCLAFFRLRKKSFLNALRYGRKSVNVISPFDNGWTPIIASPTINQIIFKSIENMKKTSENIFSQLIFNLLWRNLLLRQVVVKFSFFSTGSYRCAIKIHELFRPLSWLIKVDCLHFHWKVNLLILHVKKQTIYGLFFSLTTIYNQVIDYNKLIIYLLAWFLTLHSKVPRKIETILVTITLFVILALFALFIHFLVKIF